MKYSQKELEFIVDRIDKNLFSLNNWERDFFNNVKCIVQSGGALSPARHETLSKIWDKLGDA